MAQRDLTHLSCIFGSAQATDSRACCCAVQSPEYSSGKLPGGCNLPALGSSDGTKRGPWAGSFPDAAVSDRYSGAKLPSGRF